LNSLSSEFHADLILLIKAINEREFAHKMKSKSGELSRACPVCLGIHPDDQAHGWKDSSIGHNKNCSILRIIKKYKIRGE
jgi:hypothetical protein